MHPRAISSVILAALAACAAFPLACNATSAVAIDDPDAAPGSPEGGSTKDAAEDTSSAADAGNDAPDPGSIATEVEPNNASSATDLGTMKIPGTMNGKIDPANDVDAFKVDPQAGEFWEWTLTPSTADLAPHLAVFDTAPGSLNPTALVAGTAGAPLLLQNFVLRPGTFVAAVRDARNVPSGTGKGGPTYGYALVATKKTPQPTSVTFPTTKTGKLASLGAVDLYTFTGTSGKGFDIIIRAARKAAPSTLDSRLSLFDIAAKKAIITNDDAAGTSDSQVGSPDAAPSTYMVIVENEGTNATDLSYEIEFALRP